jgi:hypothetical protein
MTDADTMCAMAPRMLAVRTVLNNFARSPKDFEPTRRIIAMIINTSGPIPIEDKLTVHPASISIASKLPKLSKTLSISTP